ncbi:MAG: TonB-dependent receptor domain-containing protein [Nevskiales bacterium]
MTPNRLRKFTVDWERTGLSLVAAVLLCAACVSSPAAAQDELDSLLDSVAPEAPAGAEQSKPATSADSAKPEEGSAPAPDEATPANAVNEPEPQAAPEPSPSHSRVIEEIVVTATKRDSSLQETAIAVSAFSEKLLEDKSIKNVFDMQGQVPTLTVATQLQQFAVTLRGVSHEFNIAGGEPGIATNVDGVYYPRPTSAAIDGLDLRSIEALRGPQGTLYGRNTTGGAINVFSNIPSLQEFESSTSLEFGSFSQRSANLAFGLPLIADRLGLRVAGRTNRAEGFVTNAATGEDLGAPEGYAYRATALWQATDALAFTLRGDQYNDRLEGSVVKFTEVGAPFNPTANIPDPLNLPNGNFGNGRTDPDPYDLYTNLDGLTETTGSGQSLTGEWTPIEAVTVRSITASRKTGLDFLLDLDGTDANFARFPTQETSRSFSQELNIFGEVGSLKWLVGGFYFKDDLQSTLDPTLTVSAGTLAGGLGQMFNLPLLPILLEPLLDLVSQLGIEVGVPVDATFKLDQNTRSRSLFGEATYSLFDPLRLVAGARYTVDRKQGTQTTDTVLLGVSLDMSECKAGRAFDLQWRQFTPKLGVEWDAAEDVLVYLTKSRGYKAGGINLSACADSFDPEVLDSLELGLKSEWFERQLQLNLTGFLYDYQDFQANIFRAGANEIVNAAKAKISGIELEGTWLTPFAGLVLDGNAAYLDAKFEELMAADSFNPQAGPQDLSGNTLPRAPKWTTRVGMELPISIPLNPTLRLDYAYRTEYPLDIFNGPTTTQEAFGQTSVSLRMAGEAFAGGGSWQFILFAKNLENEAVFAQAAKTVTVGGTLVSYQAPRTVGARFIVKF